jgi:ATP-binding cassette subfamily B protein
MRLTTGESLLINLISVLGNIFVLGIGIYYVMSGVLSFGAFFTFESLVAFFLGSAGQLVHTQALLQTTWINFCRLYEIMELKTEQKRKNSETKKLDSLFLPIDMTDVHFRYGSRKLALNGLNMRIEAGEKVAIVGPSGAGKSTISKLLMNFYAPESGEIYFGGHDIRNLDVDCFRSMIAYLPQNVVLFKGSLEENIKQGSKSVTQDEFIKVCEMCRLDEFVKELPGGYSFKITEQGHNFSGGQKQRIALARALIQKFDLLIMDEATNGMDSITEHLIMDVVLKQLQSTVVLIAHRLACAERCQKIFVVDGGRVVESGSHKTLIAGDGLYRKMMDQYLL